MKLFSIASIASLSLLALSGSALADSSVTFSSTPFGNYFADSSGVALQDGSLVLVGSFADFSAIAALPVAQIDQAAGWSLFGSTYTASIFGNEGKLTGGVGNSTPDANAFADQQVFLWVFNAPTLSAATEYGIFTAFDADFEWLFSADVIDGDSYIELDDINITAYLGSINGNALTLTAIAVPEPATYAAILGAAGIAVVALRRRRTTQSRSI